MNFDRFVKIREKNRLPSMYANTKLIGMHTHASRREELEGGVECSITQSCLQPSPFTWIPLTELMKHTTPNTMLYTGRHVFITFLENKFLDLA